MRTALLAILCLTATATAHARTIYVDSRIGNNAYDGTSAEALNAWVGPVRTLDRAMQLLCPGDVLVLVDNGTPYFGGLSFVGSRFSGTADYPFRLEGGGAVISGAKPLGPGSWVEVSRDLWRTTPIRKGWYQLIRNGEAVPRVELPAPLDGLPDLPVGSWGDFRGRVYYRSPPGQTPIQHDFALAEEETGLTLLGVQNVVISNVTFRHFRVDGINAHDRCQNVTLNNVSSIENGRAGIVVGGTSDVTIIGGQLAGNAEDSLRIVEYGEASVTDTSYDIPPRLVE
jgi:hypothetical protein